MKVKIQKKGISLIVLVITIIIMIILAATIIISLTNNGIIDKASEAVEKTNEKQVQELASVAWANAYMNGARTKEEFKTAVEKALEDNNIDKEDYGMEVTTTGVTIVKGWLQKSDRTVVKGSTSFKIGSDFPYYDETNGGSITVETNVDWQVLGAENGELLIMSASDVRSSYTLGSSNFENAKTDYETGISKLNEICAPYGKGAYATGARSIKVEDVDRVTGYDKTTYGKGTIDEYGNIVTFLYNGTDTPAYSGSNGVTGTLTSTYSNGFHWYDLNNVYHNVTASDLTSADNNEKEIGKVKCTYYYYTVSSETDLQTVAPEAYNMLFGESGKNLYWLGSACSKVNFKFAVFGLRRVSSGCVGGYYFIYSLRDCGHSAAGVRAVVQLSPDYNP